MLRSARASALLLGVLCASSLALCALAQAPEAERLEKRWLFVWRDMTDPHEVDRVIERLPRAAAAGYNGLVVSWNVAPERAQALRTACAVQGIEIVAIVMGGPHDRNDMEGVPVEGALFVAHGAEATHVPDNPTVVANGGFEEVEGDRFAGWTMQDDVGVTTFADHEIVAEGSTSLRMENIGRNEYRHCRVAQPLALAPFRQYRVSFQVRSENLVPSDPEVKVLATDASASISFQTVRVPTTSDWTRYDIVFNSLDHTEARLYVGSWWGKDGKLWWDDITIEEIALVNVLRREGCPVSVVGENGVAYEEGRDFAPIRDPQLHPWRAWHEPPAIHLTEGTRIADGERLRVSYYHPIIVYEDRLTGCMSSERIFDDWEQEVVTARDRLAPAAYLMSHDELRVMNWCALCRGKGLTPGQLLAENVHRAAGIIRDNAPGAGIWVWNDMFDPMHNAVEHFYCVNGPLAGSWEGLDQDVGIVNWHGGLEGANCGFFADRGLRQILSGYYDGDEDGSGIARWIEKTREVEGIAGAMYTTWEDRYDALEAWAKRTWGPGR